MTTTLTPGQLTVVRDRLAAAGESISGPLSAELITGGRSNLTFLLSDGSGDRWVLRTPPRAGRTPSAHDVGREFRVTRALVGTPVPVARPVLLADDPGFGDAPFAVAEYVEGRAVRTRADLDELDDVSVDASIRALIAALAALHAVDYVGAGLQALGRPTPYAERQLRRWARQWEFVAPPDEMVRQDAARLVGRLSQAVPEQGRTTVVHGDFRIDNALLHIVGRRSRVAAVVDWELSTIGDPVADVAMMCAYRSPAFDLVLGAPSAWASDRLPDTAGLAARYEQCGGAPLDNFGFHLALASFKIAVIAAGIAHRHREGGAAGPRADTAALAVPEYIAAGLEARASPRAAGTDAVRRPSAPHPRRGPHPRPE